MRPSLEAFLHLYFAPSCKNIQWAVSPQGKVPKLIWSNTHITVVVKDELSCQESHSLVRVQQIQTRNDGKSIIRNNVVQVQSFRHGFTFWSIMTPTFARNQDNLNEAGTRIASTNVRVWSRRLQNFQDIAFVVSKQRSRDEKKYSKRWRSRKAWLGCPDPLDRA